jgi:DNA segregation ATPase FtsK/SpoIIIE-like protein
MTSRQRSLGFLVVVTLAAALALVAGFSQPVRADSEDVAMFYDDLSQYGQWVEYEKYGPVWRPSQVQEDWRPYTNGRWVPTDDGYVFESDEPWGWATYHYGNWMPTEGYGWVWVPGRTWYPSTVEWRTSPESEPVETSYVGWAPIPPPDYVPPPSYAPPSYYPGSPVTDALTAPLWIFARAASFLLGFGQPYAPAYSYMYSGVLVPPAYVPVFYPQTIIVQRYFTPTYYPPAFYGRRAVFGAYSWGPPVGYISRVTNINQTVINRTIINNSVRITHFRNVVPPRTVMNRYRYLNQIVPPALAQGRRLPPPRPVQDIRQARVHLNRPNMLAPPRNVPRVTAQIPRVQPAAVKPGHGIPGTALPGRATMHLTPQMQQQIQKLPANQRIVPAKPLPIKPATATQPGPARRGVEARPGQVQPGAPVQPGRFQPGTATRPGQVQPGRPAAGPAKPGEFHPGAARPATTPPGRAATQRETKPGAPLPPGYRGLTPEQRRQQEIEHQRQQRRGTPSQAPSQQQQERQRQLQQERLRQQQMQQRQREQPVRQQQQRQQQERLRQQQIEQQQGQRQMQERQRQMQVQQQQQRQRQMQQERQRQPQVQAQPRQAQPQQRPQPQQRREERKKHEPQQP